MEEVDPIGVKHPQTISLFGRDWVTFSLAPVMYTLEAPENREITLMRSSPIGTTRGTDSVQLSCILGRKLSV